MLFGEPNTVVANAEALFTILVLQHLDAAGAGFGQAVDRRQNVHGDVLGDDPDVGLRLLRADDPLQETGSRSSSIR